MLKSILVTTANGKPQTASSRLPFAVNVMLKVPKDTTTTYKRVRIQRIQVMMNTRKGYVFAHVGRVALSLEQINITRV